MATDDKELHSQLVSCRGDRFLLDPLNKQGGIGKVWQLFGGETNAFIELNERIVV